MDKHSPTPWRVEKSPNNSNFWVVRCDTGVSLATAWREADAALIVEAVNERNRLRDLVRRLCDELESHYHEPALMDDPCIVREAREALEDEQ